jgi:hypothetical protein
MTSRTASRFVGIPSIFALMLVLLQLQAPDALAVSLGHMQADKILFLGNSITACPREAGVPWYGLEASVPAKDYVHLLTGKINTATGGSLAINTANMDRWYYGNPLPNWTGNILNMADLFERNFNTWDNARIQNQINASPDIVVVQLGENMANGTMPQFQAALESMVTALKNKSNPNIFITSRIMGSDPAADAIKQAICAEDPSHRVFVNLVGRVDLSGAYGHPNDAGMVTVANTLYGAMLTHSAPEPGSIALLTAGAMAAGCKLFGRRVICRWARTQRHVRCGSN